MVEKSVLDCGLTVISEFRPEFPSFALSYTLKSGSRAEDNHTSGIHHLIEHMLFKGNENYDLKQIAEASDRLGGTLNALTGKEITQYYMRAVEGKLEESFDLLTGIVLTSTFPGEEIKKEKNVVIQEINESMDNPDNHAFDVFFEGVFGNVGMGSPIAGKEETVARFDRELLYPYYKEKYTPENLILAAVGSVHHERLAELAARRFSRFPGKGVADFAFIEPGFKFKTFVKNNSALNQVYAVIGFKGVAYVSPVKHKFMLMNDILGSGMSSRLYQKVREEKGLAYTISSFSDYFLETGIHIIYSIVEAEKIDEYFQAVKEEILQLKGEGIREGELERAKDHVKASLILSSESNRAKMRINVNQELYYKKEIEIKEILRSIDSAGTEDINRLLREHLDLKEVSVFLYGNVSEKDYAGYRFV